MDKCPYCKNNSIKRIHKWGLTIYRCLTFKCQYNLVIDLFNNEVRTDKDKK